jgi:hypothetical protein
MHIAFSGAVLITKSFSLEAEESASFKGDPMVAQAEGMIGAFAP